MSNPAFLRRALVFDAAASGATGLLLAAGAGPLEPLLGLPAALSFWAGVALLPFAAALVWLSWRNALPRSAVWTVIVVNALWAVDSILLLFTGWIAPTVLGTAFVVAQAAVVAVFAELQYVGLRRAGAAGCGLMSCAASFETAAARPPQDEVLSFLQTVASS